MKTKHLLKGLLDAGRRTIGAAACLLIFGLTGTAFAIPIAGANGNVVDFAGVKSAGPAGLTVQIQAEGDTINVGWDRLDLQRLQVDHPEIFMAYQKAQAGASTELNLGSFAPKAPDGSAMKVNKLGQAPRGYHETSVNGIKFAIQLPDAEPRAVLLVSIGQDGRSMRYMGAGAGTRWAQFSERQQFAVMGYSFALPPQGAQGKAPDFIFPEKGSGEALLKALRDFAQKSGKSSLAEAPIAIYGFDVLGAAFAFNFSQLYPERTLAAVVGKGAFYSAKPTEDSVKVPLLLLWGEYDRDIELWNPTDTHEEVYAASVGLKPNWAYTMEPRTGPGETPFSQKMAMTFLDRMALARLPASDELAEMDRDRAFVGDLDTFEISRMEDPEEALPETKTWLPDGEIAKLWEQFLNGTMELDAPN